MGIGIGKGYDDYSDGCDPFCRLLLLKVISYPPTLSPLPLFFADMATYEKTVQLMTGKYSYLFYGAQE